MEESRLKNPLQFHRMALGVHVFLVENHCHSALLRHSWGDIQGLLPRVLPLVWTEKSRCFAVVQCIIGLLQLKHLLKYQQHNKNVFFL